MKKKIPYSTPDGYFEALKRRLSDIPAEHRTQARPLGAKWVPYLALASFFAAAVVLGNLFLSGTTGRGGATEDEIVEYLIDSGTTLAQLYEYNF
ncbi:MAG: hypothetical protein J5871_06350 [Bacteroidales bacterium]|nr:hypothetical protein [Bacteroidales bacterium]